jgi:hypothetical protein
MKSSSQLRLLPMSATIAVHATERARLRRVALAGESDFIVSGLQNEVKLIPGSSSERIVPPSVLPAVFASPAPDDLEAACRED